MIGIASYSALMALLAIGTLRAPAVGFAAVLCLYGLKQWGQSTTMLLVTHHTATNLVIGSLVLVGLAVRVASGRCLFCRMPPVALLVLALYGYALLSLAWTPDEQTALEQWRMQIPYVITVTALGPLLIGATSDVRQFANWTIVVGAALMTLAMTFGHWGSRGLIVLGDVYETETNPLAMVSLAGTVSIFAALSVQRGTPLLWRALLVLVVPLGLAVILRSGSRGQLGSAIFAIIAAWPIAYRQKNIGSFLVWVAGAAAIGLTVSFASDLVVTDTARWAAVQSGGLVEGRLDTGAALVSRAAASPLTLLFGLGNSGAFYYIGYYPHVASLETLGEEGAIGAAMYLSIVYLALRSVVRLAFTPAVMKDTVRRTALALLTGGFLFELLLAQKQGSLLSSVYTFAYAILLGRLELLARRRAAQPSRTEAGGDDEAVAAAAPDPDSSTLAH
jgi:hypothetical protein